MKKLMPLRRVMCALLVAAVMLSAQGPRGGGEVPGRGGGRGAGMFGGPQGFIAGAPYSGLEVVQSQETLADGNTITSKRQTSVFRDGQGRVRTEEMITPPAGSGRQPYTQVTILDYVAGTRYLLDSSTMTVHQSPLRVPPVRGAGASAGGGAGNPAARLIAPRAGENTPQVALTALAPQAVNGLLSTGSHHVMTIPAGQIGNERPIQVSRTVWVSNELKVPIQIKASDPRFGTTVMDLTNIVQSEPSPSLFMVPGGYTVHQTGGRSLDGAGGRGFGGPGSGPGGPRPQARGPRPAQQ